MSQQCKLLGHIRSAHIWFIGIVLYKDSVNTGSSQDGNTQHQKPTGKTLFILFWWSESLSHWHPSCRHGNFRTLIICHGNSHFGLSPFMLISVSLSNGCTADYKSIGLFRCTAIWQGFIYRIGKRTSLSDAIPRTVHSIRCSLSVTRQISARASTAAACRVYRSKFKDILRCPFCLL